MLFENCVLRKVGVDLYCVEDKGVLLVDDGVLLYPNEVRLHEQVLIAPLIVFQLGYWRVMRGSFGIPLGNSLVL